MTATDTQMGAEWDALYASVVLQLRKLDEDGCPDVRALSESDVETYPDFMLAALSRSYVMARWILLNAATKAADIDKLRVYERFLADPKVNSRLVEPTIMVLRRAGHHETAGMIERDHFYRYDMIRNMYPDSMREKLDWSETNMEMIQVVFVTGSDQNRATIAADPLEVLGMIRERSITTAGELFDLMDSNDGGAMALTHGAL